MSQDYAKRAAHHKQKMSPKNNSPISALLIFFTLAVVIGFVGFLYYLAQISPTPDSTQKSNVETTIKTETATAKKKAPRIEQSEPESEYDFYKLLPESEVIPPKVEEYSSTPIQNSLPKSYLLQAGSFRSYQDADRLRAKLLLQGLEVKVQGITNKSGGRWHRVLVGPFSSRAKLNHAQDVLARANTESMLIEIKQ